MGPSKRLSEAFDFARAAHGEQTRKGTSIPYLSHPMAVASLALEYGGDEDQAIGALLHDTVEDCGVTYAEIERRFGAAVAKIVEDCTDAETTPKPPWKRRKERYIAQLKTAGERSLLVSACDKLHNARAIARDVSRRGPEVWKRFNAPPSEILWYYESLLEAFRGRLPDAIFDDLRAAVSELKRLAAAAPGSDTRSRPS